MQVVILAAGKGERMRPLTLAKPKPLLEVCGTSLIEHHINHLKESGFDEIIINVSWLSQQIMQKLGNGSHYGVSIRYSSEGSEPLETGGGLFKALKLLDPKPFLVVNADIKTNFNFSSIKHLSPDMAHLIMINNPSHHLSGDFSIDCNQILSHQISSTRLTYSGIGIYNRSLFKGCKHGKYSVVPLLKKAMTNHLITGQYFDGQWDDIGTIDRLISINKNCKKSRLNSNHLTNK